MFFSKLAFVVAAASSALAHSNMFQPTPRLNQDFAYVSRDQNACGYDGTFIPEENNFQRGQQVPLKWWWNNHDGGFIKISLIKTMANFVEAGSEDALLHRVNTIQGQCYTRACDRFRGFDSGQTRACEGAPVEIPNWVSDGEYILQWSHFGGYNSDAVATRQLPIYHTCANIRISGGAALQERPSDWTAPFFGGDQVQINGQSATNQQCAYKNFSEEPNPANVNVRDDDGSNIRFGGPTNGWAAPGNTNQKRADAVYLPRLGHIARRQVAQIAQE
jgi:hypothetical protein